MIITHGTKKQEIEYLSQLFCKLFKDKVEWELFHSIYRKLALYKYNDNQELFQDFVQEYLKLRNSIVSTREDLAEFVKSADYKDSNLIYKLRLKRKSSKVEKLCKSICIFEHEFYQRTNISILKEEQVNKKQSESLN